MKFDRLLIFKIANIVLIIASLTGGMVQGASARKYLNRKIIYVSPRIEKSQYLFTKNEIEDICVNLGVTAIYDASQSGMAVSGTASSYAKIIGASKNYAAVNHFQYIEGSFWTEEGAGRYEAVLNEALAWRLFGTAYAVGNKIEFNGDEYDVAGVVKQTEFSTDDCSMWLPFDKAYGQGAVIEGLYILPEDYNEISSIKQAEQVISYLGKNKQDYIITDINRYIADIENRYKITLFALALYFIIFIPAYIKGLVRLRIWNMATIVKLILAIICLCTCVAAAFLTWNYAYPIPSFGIGGLPDKVRLSNNLRQLSAANLYSNGFLLAGALSIINVAILHQFRQKIPCG